jgi:hypothetical protein
VLGPCLLQLVKSRALRIRGPTKFSAKHYEQGKWYPTRTQRKKVGRPVSYLFFQIRRRQERKRRDVSDPSMF